MSVGKNSTDASGIFAGQVIYVDGKLYVVGVVDKSGGVSYPQNVGVSLGFGKIYGNPDGVAGAGWGVSASGIFGVEYGGSFDGETHSIGVTISNTVGYSGYVGYGWELIRIK